MNKGCILARAPGGQMQGTATPWYLTNLNPGGMSAASFFVQFERFENHMRRLVASMVIETIQQPAIWQKR
jgi:hypothetical protein